jgi:hypothetical protein
MNSGELRSGPDRLNSTFDVPVFNIHQYYFNTRFLPFSTSTSSIPLEVFNCYPTMNFSTHELAILKLHQNGFKSGDTLSRAMIINAVVKKFIELEGNVIEEMDEEENDFVTEVCI